MHVVKSRTNYYTGVCQFPRQRRLENRFLFCLSRVPSLAVAIDKMTLGMRCTYVLCSNPGFGKAYDNAIKFRLSEYPMQENAIEYVTRVRYFSTIFHLDICSIV